MDVKMPSSTGSVPAADRQRPDRASGDAHAFSQRELVDRASQAGAMAYVVKPFSKADLIPASRSRALDSPRSKQWRPRSAT